MTLAAEQATGATPAPDAEPLYRVRNLRKWFPVRAGMLGRTVTNVQAVDGISFDVRAGETIGLVGESGCGKSVTSLSVMGLVPSPPGNVAADAMLFEGRDVLGLSADERRKLRGSAQRLADDRRRRRGALVPHHVTENLRDLLPAAGKHHAHRIGYADSGAINQLGRRRVEVEADDEIRDDLAQPLADNPGRPIANEFRVCLIRMRAPKGVAVRL